MILESLYKPTVKDQLSGLNQKRWSVYGTATVAATSVAVAPFANVPPDTVRVVQGFSCVLSPGAAQTPTWFQIQSANFGGLLYGAWGAAVGAAVGDYYAVTEQLGWLLPPSSGLNIVGNFDAGAAANSVVCSFWGFEVPRANIEL